MNYCELSDRELDALVAERVMGWSRYNDSEGSAWHANRVYAAGSWWSPSLDDNAARLVRNRIAEMGHEERFVELLCYQVGYYGRHPGFPCLQATPRKQCEAALTALDGLALQANPRGSESSPEAIKRADRDTKED